MKKIIQEMPRWAINAVFGFFFLIALLMAAFPPFYLAASGQRALVLGMPFAVFYWILSYLILALAMWALYKAEDVRGELDEERADTQERAS